MSTENSIAQLLEDGLDAYGLGDRRKAVDSWNQVLRIEPSNQMALDYLESAGAPVPSSNNVIDIAQHRCVKTVPLTERLKDLLSKQNYTEAIEVLLQAKRDTPQDAALGRAIQRVKDKYVVVLVRKLGKLDQRVQRTEPLNDDTSNVGLDDASSEVISLIDNESSLGDIIHSSVLEKHHTLEVLVALYSAKRIELVAPSFSLPLAVAGRQANEVAQVLYAPAQPLPDYDSLFRNATLAYVQGELERALQLFQQCQNLRPDSDRVRHNIERLQSSTK